MRLLLVEDNAELAANLVELFSEGDNTVTWAPSGARAMQAALKGFDVALLDLRLPDLDGTAVLTQLRALAPEAEVLVTTGNADLESAIGAVRAGAFAYLVKPVAVSELMLTVQRAFERVELRVRARQLQEELARNEARHRLLLEKAQVLIAGLDREGRISFANRALEDATQWTRDELLGRPFVDVLVPAADQAEQHALLARVSQAPLPEREMDLVTRSGTTKRVQLRFVPGSETSTESLYAVALDLTRQRELERNARVSEKLAAVGTMTAGLAHEVRNPLNAALLQLALLERRVGRLQHVDLEPFTQPLSLVRAELARLNQLLEDFLAFARPREVGHMPVDLSQAVAEVAGLNKPVAAAAGRKLVVQVPPGLRVAGDAATLKGAVVNLVRNALDACSSRVDVSLREEDGNVILTITDDGPGMPPAVLQHLFEPFFTTKEKGTGLGLPMVYSCVTAHGGQVAITPLSTGGTMARVVLPALRAN